MEYIAGEDRDTPGESGGTPFCFICRAGESDDDRRHWVVARFPQSLVILNRYPYNNGHILVATGRHIGRWESLTREERIEIGEVIALCMELLQSTLRPEGVNAGVNIGTVAGAGLPDHLHWHIVPRWSGDTNFMPVIADAKIIPQSLEAVWCLFREKLPALRGRYGL
jgi:ATP adenylyltransferase